MTAHPTPAWRPLALTACAGALAVATVLDGGAVATAEPATGGLKPVGAGVFAPGATPRASGDAAPAVPFPDGLALGLRRGEQLTREGSDSSDPYGLVSAGLPPLGEDTVYSGGGTVLVLQADGNLVEYETTTGAVLFTTGTTTGQHLVYQDDGNVVLYDDAGQPLFSTGTAGDETGQYFAPYGNGSLLIQNAEGGAVVSLGTPVTRAPGVVNAVAESPNGAYLLTVQADGNVVGYRQDGSVFFSTGTYGSGPVRFAAQADGNLVVYSLAGRALWASGSVSPEQGYYQLDVQDDGNVVLYSTSGADRVAAVWASGTVG